MLIQRQLKASILLASLLLSPARVPGQSAPDKPTGNPALQGASETKRSARSRYYEKTEDEVADPMLQGRGRDRALRKRASLRLVVMISGQLGDAPTLGAGILFGRAKDKVYVVTANHVVRRGPDVAHDVSVKFKDAPDMPARAVVTPYFDSETDVAVLEVDRRTATGFDPCSLFLFQLNDGQTLKRGDPVNSVGNPQGFGWGMSVTPEVVASVDADRILFQSTFLSPGHSGGALLNIEGSIVGMLQSDQQPYGMARRLSAILPVLRKWNFTVELYQRTAMLQDRYSDFESVLEEAVARGDLAAVNSLLEACPDVNTMSYENRTPLHIAAMHGQTNVVRRLIALGANVNLRAHSAGAVGTTPLALAVTYGHFEVVKLLLEAGADPKDPDSLKRGDTLPLHRAAHYGHTDIVKLLARNQALLEIVQYNSGTPLHVAVQAKQLEVIKALLEAGASVNARDSDGRTPLHTAVLAYATNVIPVLLKAGADPNAIDRWGKKPLDMASDQRRQTIQELLRFRNGK